jgi:putative inorganic carbon (HCO3(-)) transporter
MLNIPSLHQRVKPVLKTQSFLNRIFLQEKLLNWPGYLIFFTMASGMGFLMAKNLVLGLGVSGFVVGLAVIIVCFVSTETGLYINLIYSFFAFHISRFFFNDTFPVGIASDILIIATLFSFFIRRVELRKQIIEFANTSVIIWTIIVYLYIGLELFNPNTHSFEGWFMTFRKSLLTLILLFIAYNVLDTYHAIKKFIIALFIVCSIAGIYGCIQQWHGLFNFERAWATADESRFGLIFINGEFRKFSTMADPTGYGVLMASCAIFFTIIAWNQKRLLYKITLITGVLFMLLGMAYSGTRTANAMVVGGLAMFILLTFNKKSTRVFTVFAGAIFLVLLYGPFYGNATINRFRTTFTGTQDESFKVREVNRAFIQPYIHSHPIGGGLMTTGAGGLRFNPHHRLSGFPPDSGYLKKALEAGWIGLGLICILYYAILRTGIKSYFQCRNENIRVIYAASISSIFSFYIAEFAQDAIGQITDIVVYYPIIAIMLTLKNSDKHVLE